MSPSALRNMTLKGLRAARRAMLSTSWTLGLETADEETRAAAGKELLRVHHAILKLENEQLAEIRDALLENEAELVAGTESLSDALHDLSRLEEVLGAVSEALAVVGRVVAVL
jgi:DNA repair exonuclease SbcCD ATPase subunit